MSTLTDPQKELADVIQRAIQGVRDEETGRKAREEMDRMREETRQRIGTVEVATERIREARDCEFSPTATPSS